MFDIYVYHPAGVFNDDCAMLYRPAGIVDVWESVQWLEYYQDTGEVLLVCPCTAQNRSMLAPGNLLRFQSETAAVIQQTDIEDKAGVATLTVRAEPYPIVLEERLGEHTTLLSGTAELAAFLEQNHRCNGLARRVEMAGDFSKISCAVEASWQNLLEVLKNVCTETGLGFTGKLAASGHNIYNRLVLYSGVDRSLPQHYKGYLGGRDDVDDLRIVESLKEYKNVAIVAGKEDETGYRPTTEVKTGSVLPHQRRELFVDAAGVSRKYKKSVSTGQLDEHGYPIYKTVQLEYTAAEYAALLETKGRQELAKHAPRIEISAGAKDNCAPILYGRDYHLGDIIPLVLENYGLRLKARVAGVKHVCEVSAGEYRNILLADFEEM